MNSKKPYITGIILAIVVILGSYLFRKKIGESFFTFIAIVSLIVATAPFVILLIQKQGKQKQKEEKFLEFTRDLVENVKSGTPINKGIYNLKDKDYGSLTNHIKKLSNQLEVGINLEKALSTFSKETKSTVIARSVILISEAQKAGGDISNILESVSTSVAQTEEIKKERKAAISNLVVQGYIIFMVFIVIMLVLEYAIFPIAIQFSQNAPQTLGSASNVTPPPMTTEQISRPMFFLLLTQSLFAGLIIGKISEGNVLSGIKHSFILITITLLITTGAKAFLG